MRLFKTLFLLTCLSYLAGCPAADNDPLPWSLDNKGGFSHGGLLITLNLDGTYIESHYSDVGGVEAAKQRRTGIFTLNTDKTQLTLAPNQETTSQQLFLYEHEDEEYWLHENAREALKLPHKKWLSQILRRVKTP